jgi:nicotinamide mononucleotide adenylyltransferase
MARDWVRRNSEFVVVGGYLSPVGDAYVKKGLAPAEHRVNMCRRAVESQDERTRFVMVDNWEALQTKYQPTAKVLDHFNHELNIKMGGVEDSEGNKIKVHIALLGGADLVETFSQPGVWSDQDLTHILCDCEFSYHRMDRRLTLSRRRIHHRENWYRY